MRTDRLNGIPLPAPDSCLLSSIVLTLQRGAGILTCCSIDYAFRPRLRVRLTLGGRTWPRKPRVFGDKDSHLVYRYSCRHYHFCPLHGSFQYRFAAEQNAPLPLGLAAESIASVVCLSPEHFRRGDSRLVSYYALFKWWLPLSQHTSCL